MNRKPFSKAGQRLPSIEAKTLKKALKRSKTPHKRNAWLDQLLIKYPTKDALESHLTLLNHELNNAIARRNAHLIELKRTPHYRPYLNAMWDIRKTSYKRDKVLTLLLSMSSDSSLVKPS
jgi:hypothetical protein